MPKRRQVLTAAVSFAAMPVVYAGLNPLIAGNHAMPQTKKPSKLKVPGATLYYEVGGGGPLLLLIPGGATDAGIFAALSDQLVNTFTIVSLDPRGNSRSTIDGAPADLSVDEHGDDAARLIDVLGVGPAFVFGTSGGGQVGLNLAARYPGHVRTLVAHEPPCLLMLPDPTKDVADDKALVDLYHLEGVQAAMQKFMKVSGMGDGPPPVPQSPAEVATFERINGNLDYFFAHGMLPLSLYQPDFTTLRANPSKVLIGIGEQSAGQVTYRTGVALAEKLGSKPVLFPGNHMGYLAQPDVFATTLRQSFLGN